MRDMKELLTLLSQAGYKTEKSAVEQETVFCVVRGGKLEEIEGVLRATGDLCNLGIIIGLFDSVPERARYTILGQLLELNFDHPLAHTSIVQAPVEPTKSDTATRVSVIIVETSFFWPNNTRDRLDARCAALHALSFAVSQVLASRGALSNTNPFYSRLKGSSSAVVREDFPKIQTK